MRYIHKNRKGTIKLLVIAGLILLCLVIIATIYLNSLLKKTPPKSFDEAMTIITPEKINDSLETYGSNYFLKVSPGFYQMYVTGNPGERGNIIGAFTKELHAFQEEAFINQVNKMIPSPFYLKFLKYFVAYFNRDIEKYIPEEYLAEIFAESRYMSGKYDELIGTPYMRLLNYHAAHDIGHALQDKNYVAGCTSFASWGDNTTDGDLIAGRNFDFYAGDDFARNKILACIQPDSGIAFAMVTWPGMIGAVSGMNLQQISVTINAAKSSVPTEAKTPISIVARSILQYASSLQEAITIAQKFELFVSESILVTSGKENKAILIEKSPDKTGIYQPAANELICSNHFLSDAFKNDENVKENIWAGSSGYRYARLKQLLTIGGKLNEHMVSTILRDPYGMDGTKLGWGNEKAINQLIAHHSVIFKPAQLLMWVSTNPHQLGEYHCFDLDKIFKSHLQGPISEKRIIADNGLIKMAYDPYREYKTTRNWVHENIDSKNTSVIKRLNRMLELNPDYFEPYEFLGDYYKNARNKNRALQYYKTSLLKPLPTKKDSLRIAEKMINIGK